MRIVISSDQQLKRKQHNSSVDDENELTKWFSYCVFVCICAMQEPFFSADDKETKATYT